MRCDFKSETTEIAAVAPFPCFLSPPQSPPTDSQSTLILVQSGMSPRVAGHGRQKVRELARDGLASTSDPPTQRARYRTSSHKCQRVCLTCILCCFARSASKNTIHNKVLVRLVHADGCAASFKRANWFGCRSVYFLRACVCLFVVCVVCLCFVLFLKRSIFMKSGFCFDAASTLPLTSLL